MERPNLRTLRSRAWRHWGHVTLALLGKLLAALYRYTLRTFTLYLPISIVAVTLMFFGMTVSSEAAAVSIPWLERAIIIAATLSALSYAVATSTDTKQKVVYAQASEGFFRSCVAMILCALVVLGLETFEFQLWIELLAKITAGFYGTCGALFFTYGLFRLSYTFEENRIVGIE